MGKFEDLTGNTYGRLTVLERAENKGGRVCWLCRCSCKDETIVTVSGKNLKSGNTKSCGCLVKEGTHKTHGKAGDPIYNTWKHINQRCTNPNYHHYKDYGGRGITICDEWRNDFQAFYDYVSKLPHFGEKGYTLDRINNNGNYEPSNVRWADNKTQQRNRRNNRLVEYQGELMTLTEAAEKSGISCSALRDRYYRDGLRGDDLFKPVKGR